MKKLEIKNHSLVLCNWDSIYIPYIITYARIKQQNTLLYSV